MMSFRSLCLAAILLVSPPALAETPEQRCDALRRATLESDWTRPAWDHEARPPGALEFALPPIVALLEFPGLEPTILAWRLTPRVAARSEVLALELALPDLVPKLAGLLIGQTTEDFCDINSSVERTYRAWVLIERAIAPIRLSDLRESLSGLSPDAYMRRYTPDASGRILEAEKASD